MLPLSNNLSFRITRTSKCPFLRALSMLQTQIEPLLSHFAGAYPILTHGFSTQASQMQFEYVSPPKLEVSQTMAHSPSGMIPNCTEELPATNRRNYEVRFQQAIDQVKAEGRYRHFAQLSRKCGAFPYAEYYSPRSCKTKTVINWCSNDYLCMGQNGAVLEQMQGALQANGAGAGGTRNISGTNRLHAEAERELASLHHKEQALLFTSCYVANDSVLSTLTKIFPDLVMISDAMNHASMIQGILRSKAEKHVYEHNNLRHLEEQLAKLDINRPKLILFESVNSMEGTIAPMQEICDLAEKYNAMTFCDEVHAVGLYGKSGGGVAEKEGCLQRLTMITGTLAKGYGLMGGYLASRADIVDAMRSLAAGFIFSTALPPVIVSGILASVRHLKQNSQKRNQMWSNVKELKQALMKEGIPVMDTPSHIVPVMIGNAIQCKQITDQLIENHDIYVQPINYPTVPRGKERLRLTCTPKHTKELRDHLVEALVKVLPETGVELTPNHSGRVKQEA